MKISCNWLKEYIPTELEPVEIARILTDCGLEVEAIEEFESVRGGLKGVVIGQVLSAMPHPNADKLTCCKVNVGGSTALDIVCGAPNVAAGQKVPVATVGTVIYKGEESFTIKAAKLRGEPSEGMICAEDELGLGDSHAGIMVLDAAATIGLEASEYFGVTQDTLLEVAITPNRSDAASHFGVARDLAAALKNRETQHTEVPFSKPALTGWNEVYASRKTCDINVSVENPEACKRYSGLTLHGLKVKESPAWLQNRLKAVGLRPINNIVDITNFVLMETGQPLHAFDLERVEGNHVIVKKLAAGTKFVTLDGVERELGADDLMICNQKEGMCIGGVFGGIKSGVTGETTSIFLESACFDPTHIRKTSKLHNLKTDASFRFERGTDPNMTIYAMQRAALMILELAGGYVSSDLIDIYPEPVLPKVIDVSISRMESLIGKVIGKDRIRQILLSLDIEVQSETAEGFTLAIPPFKVDVEREADVVEEVLRIYGYNNVEMAESMHASLSYFPKPDPEHLQNVLSNFLSNNGFSEILTNSLVSSSVYEKTGIFSPERSVRILNPLSRDLDIMRQTLLFSGLESVVHNLNRKQTNIKFYEFGNVYSINEGQSDEPDVTVKYAEKKKLAVYISGNQQNESWYSPERKADHTYMKSLVFPVLRKAGIPLWKLGTGEADSRIFSSGECFSLGKSELLSMGKIQPALLKLFDIRQEVYYAEIDWSTLLAEVQPDAVKFRDVPRFPEVRRDLSLLLDSQVKFADIEAVAYKSVKDVLKEVNLFDVYEGDKIEAGKKSYAVSFIFRDEQKTMTDVEVDKMMMRITTALTQVLGASVRK